MFVCTMIYWNSGKYFAIISSTTPFDLNTIVQILSVEQARNSILSCSRECWIHTFTFVSSNAAFKKKLKSYLQWKVCVDRVLWKDVQLANSVYERRKIQEERKQRAWHSQIYLLAVIKDNSWSFHLPKCWLFQLLWTKRRNIHLLKTSHL